MTDTKEQFSNAVKITMELAPDEAEALAQFAKRVAWEEQRACTSSDDEAYKVGSAFDVLKDALADAGHSPI